VRTVRQFSAIVAAMRVIFEAIALFGLHLLGRPIALLPAALLAAGGSLREVQEMLGHSSYALTADVYAHVLDDQRRATADRIEQAWGAAISGA